MVLSFSVEPDRKYGAPNVLNPIDAKTIPAGEEFELPEPLETDSVLGMDPQTGDIYTGSWVFHGWNIPEYVTTREIGNEPLSLLGQLTPEMFMASETKTLCQCYCSAEFTGCWEFVPGEKLAVPDKLESGDELPLSGAYDSLDGFWPQREAQLNRVYSTGLFSQSLIRYVNDNIKGTPLKNREFASVELSDAERADFMYAVREAYSALIYETPDTIAVRNGIQSVIAATESDNTSFGTAFVVYCADKAGLLTGKGKSLIQTADISQLYDFLKYDACADFIAMDDLLDIYGSEDGAAATTLTVNGTAVDFAVNEDSYDVQNKKNTVHTGDLIVLMNELDKPSSLGIIESVNGRSLTYVLCDKNGIPIENTLDEDEISVMSRMGIKAEIIGLRSCDSSRIIYQFLKSELKLPEASILGVMGNMYYESKFSTTALGDGYTSFGLCQWHNERFLNLVVFCMKNNYNIASLEGQLNYLAYELEGEYSELLSELYSGDKSASWVKTAAYSFCKTFEQPANLELNATLRGKMAAGAIWNSYSQLFLSDAREENMLLSEEVRPPASNQQSDYILCTVKAGDTLASICESFGLDYLSHRYEVIAMNGLSNENMIYEGQTLILSRALIQSTQE